jgi:hypothetical protein
MLFIILGIQILIIAAGVGFHLVRNKHDRSAVGAFEAFIPWFFFAIVGLGGVRDFFYHTFDPNATAELIGWPAGNPFQSEVAMANLSYGILGLLSLHYRGIFWWATSIAYSIFLWGDAYVHIREIIVNNNREPANAGFPLYADILIPAIAYSLLLIHWRLRSRAAVRGRPVHA